jgi:hypothetical protein
MSEIDHQLDRLLRAAHRAEGNLPAEMPFGLEGRVLADWRQEKWVGPEIVWLPWLKGALVCSVLLLLLSAALSYKVQQPDEPNELALVDSVIQLSMVP